MARVPVETVLSARDVNTVAMFQRLAGAAQKYEAVVGQAKSAFNSFQQLATGGTVLALGAGFVSAATGLTKLNKELESTTNQLAGSIQVYKFAANYNDALLMAEGTLRRIKKDAADLPGTDTDFIRSFSINFPEQAQRGVKTLDEAINRSNRLTAVLLTKGVDSNQIGRDLGLMMRGQAGADVRSFMELKGQMGVKDAAAFNALSAQKRFEKLDEVIKKNKDGIDAFANTWEAVSSTSESYMKSLVIAGSKPLFEEAKKNLKAMNDYLGPMMPRIERALGMSASAGLAGVGYLGGRIGGAIAGATPDSGVMGRVSEGASPMFNSLATVGNSLLTVLDPVLKAFSDMGFVTMQVASTLLPGLGTGLELIAGVLTTFARMGLQTMSSILKAIGPMLVDIASVVSSVIGFFANVLTVVLSQAKNVFGYVFKYLENFAEALKYVYDWVKTKLFGQNAGSVFSKELTDEWGAVVKDARKNLGIEGIDAVGGIRGFMQKMEEDRKRAEEKRAKDEYTAALRAGQLKRPTINQDFRGSKFSIEQKFASGFDPGRVLTAVREDAAALAQRRLTAGTTPLFGANI